ncbi:D(2) dopamine receptor-like [Acanthaster planci]|uniref:D(2) dopamine receptor-like n=1 Tax=Acanthaster planci TaxID=133434 RepID=A0A8B7ZGZ8_ACAPL|nr:D(2) dopamine receptor-like [Acanthaster planci]
MQWDENLDTNDRASATFLVMYNVLIILIGVPGNSLILTVYWGKSHKCSTHILIMALAVADLIICLLRIWDVTWNCSVLAGADIPDLRLRFNCFDFTMVGTSIWVTAVIALDRYDCVCRPSRRRMSDVRAKKAVVVGFAISTIVNTPLYIKVALEDEGSVALDMVMYVLQITSFILPILIMSVCYTLVFLTIRKHVKGRVVHPSDDEVINVHENCSTRSQKSLCVSGQVRVSIRPSPGPFPELFQQPRSPFSHVPKETTSDKTRRRENLRQKIGHKQFVASLYPEGGATSSATLPRRLGCRRSQSPSPALQRRTTLMLFITSVVFVLCWMPFWIKVLYEIFGNASVFLNTFMETLYLNNVINPFIYGLANRRFRKDCKDVFRRMRKC